MSTEHPTLSERIGRLIHGFDAPEHRESVRQLATEVAGMERQLAEAKDRMKHAEAQQKIWATAYNEIRKQRDKLAEALRMIATHDEADGQCDNGHTPRWVALNALATLDRKEAPKPKSDPAKFCSYCNEQILPGQPTVADHYGEPGERQHIGCAAEDQDGVDFDRDFGDS